MIDNCYFCGERTRTSSYYESILYVREFDKEIGIRVNFLKSDKYSWDIDRDDTARICAKCGDMVFPKILERLTRFVFREEEGYKY